MHQSASKLARTWLQPVIGLFLLAGMLGGCRKTTAGPGASYRRGKLSRRVRLTQVSAQAEAAGLKPGDELLAIDGRSVERMGQGELSRHLHGRVGSTVKLLVARGDEVLELKVRRLVLQRKGRKRRE